MLSCLTALQLCGPPTWQQHVPHRGHHLWRDLPAAAAAGRLLACGSGGAVLQRQVGGGCPEDKGYGVHAGVVPALPHRPPAGRLPGQGGQWMVGKARGQSTWRPQRTRPGAGQQASADFKPYSSYSSAPKILYPNHGGRCRHPLVRSCRKPGVHAAQADPRHADARRVHVWPAGRGPGGVGVPEHELG